MSAIKGFIAKRIGRRSHKDGATEDGQSVDDSNNGSMGSLEEAAHAMREERAKLNKEYRSSGLLDKFRESIGDVVKDPFIDDACLLRFLRADLGDIQKATARLTNTLAWRHKTNPERVVCRACTEDPKAHYMHHIGYDKFGRAAIYSCFALARDHSVEHNLQHLVQGMEHVTAVTSPEAETYVWVCDFHGFGLANCNVRLTLGGNEIFGKHYPERVGTFLFVEAPRIFSALWRNVRPFVDKRTYRKAQFIEGPKKDGGRPLRKRLLEIFDVEYVDWLIAEMLENRDSSVSKTKTVSSNPEGKHDPRGPPSHLAKFSEDKEAFENTAVGIAKKMEGGQTHTFVELPDLRASQADQWGKLEAAAVSEVGTEGFEGDPGVSEGPVKL